MILSIWYVEYKQLVFLEIKEYFEICFKKIQEL